MTIKKDVKLLLLDKFTIPVADIAEAIIERMEEYEEEEEMEEALQNAMDDELIYTEDLWTIMAYYQTPQEANFSEAMELFYGDLLEILYILYKVNA